MLLDLENMLILLDLSLAKVFLLFNFVIGIAIFVVCFRCCQIIHSSCRGPQVLSNFLWLLTSNRRCSVVGYCWLLLVTVFYCSWNLWVSSTDVSVMLAERNGIKDILGTVQIKSQPPIKQDPDSNETGLSLLPPIPIESRTSR